jgi:hypothetical protein
LAFILIAGTAFGQTLQKGGMVSIHEWTLTLDPGGGIESAIGEFVSENKLELKAYNYDKSIILAKYEINFPTPDIWNAKVKVKGSAETWDVVINYNYSRVK